MVLATVIVGTAMPLADTTSMNVGRFFIARALDSSPDETRWLTAGYSLFVAIGIPLSHRLRGLLSERALYSWSTIAFMVGSVVSMLAHFMPAMMVGRALQGLSGGVLLPLSLSLVSESFPEALKNRAVGLFSVGNALAVSLGPTIGGFLVDNPGWRWTMGIHLPIGFLTLFLAHFSLENHPRTDPKRFDLAGWLLYGGAAFLFMYAIMEGERFGWHSGYLFGFAMSALAFFFLYLLWAQHFPDPIFPTELFRHPAFVLLTAANFLRSTSVFGRLYLLPLFLEGFYRFQSHHAGMLILTGAVAELLIPALAGFLDFNVHFPWVAFGGGSLLIGLSSVAYLNLPAESFSLSAVVVPQIVFGIGMAMVQVALNPLAQSTVPRPLARVGGVFQLAVMFLGGMWGTVFARHLLDNMVPAYLSGVVIPNVSVAPGPVDPGRILRLAQAFSYNLDFWILGLLSIGSSVLVFAGLAVGYFMKRFTDTKEIPQAE
jgi:DHA2 family multidrug resistance protein